MTTSSPPTSSFTKPGDHPEFFRFPAPEGASRESSIRLDAEGYFWHDGVKVDHPRLAAALHSWITRHPDDHRFILTNGYDWTYFKVDATPFFVTSVRAGESGSGGATNEGASIVLTLSDGTEVPLDPTNIFVDDAGALVVSIAHKSRQYLARFTRFAQSQIAPWLVETAAGGVGISVGDRIVEPSPLADQHTGDEAGPTP